MTIFVDASAIVAMIAREPEANSFAELLRRDQLAITSPLAVWEAARGVQNARAVPLVEARRLVSDFLIAAGLQIVAVEPADAELALDAHARFGKGVDPAALNFGDFCLCGRAAERRGSAVQGPRFCPDRHQGCDADMIEVALSREDPWPEATDWDALATGAATAALALTPHAELATGAAAVEISIRLATDAEVRTLNAQYRHKDKPTNVLSFPMVQPDLLDTVGQNSDAGDSWGGEVLLGDIVLAYETCAREAEEKGVRLADHATHLIVHGTLHLLGYDHAGDGEAEAMEAIEIAALAALGIADPYFITED